MRIALVMAAAASLAVPAVADPHKPVSRDNQSRHPSAPVILASADTPPPPPADSAQQNAAPAKRRAGRVTTCRCGDPQPGAETPER